MVQYVVQRASIAGGSEWTRFTAIERTSIALPEAKCSGGADDGTADGARTTMTTTTANIAASATKGEHEYLESRSSL